MIKQIKIYKITAVIGGYSTCACGNNINKSLNKAPFMLISNNENTCKYNCCATLESDYYKFNANKKKSCLDFDYDYDSSYYYNHDYVLTS